MANPYSWPTPVYKAPVAGEAHQRVITFQEILDRGPNAFGVMEIAQKDIPGPVKEPHRRVVPHTWTCGMTHRDDGMCLRVYPMQTQRSDRCFREDYRNVRHNVDREAVVAGDELNMMPERLKAKWWECKTCHSAHQIDDATVLGVYCTDCRENGRRSWLEGDCYVWNEFDERLGSYDGYVIVRLGPWQNTLFAIWARQDRGWPFDLVE